MDAAGEERLEAIAGDPPDLRVVQPGCPFAPRCPFVMDRCRVQNPALIEVKPGQTVACHLYRPIAGEEAVA
jgi:oligopeptide/dipeptide ABC transporter ATP-binding protein